MRKSSYYIVNAITLYRMMAAVLLLYFIITDQPQIFKWFLAISFFTDAIDGFLARKFKVETKTGSSFDSVADDLTVLMAIIGVVVFKPGFIKHELVLITVLLVLYLTQTTMALIRYKKISSFHTILAKMAAVLQGIFFLLIFFLPQWPLWMFYIAATATILDLVEEIILVMLLPKWETDVKGLHWIVKSLEKISL